MLPRRPKRTDLQEKPDEVTKTDASKSEDEKASTPEIVTVECSKGRPVKKPLYVKIFTEDKKWFRAPFVALKLSDTIYSMLMDAGFDGDDDGDEWILPISIDSVTMRQAIDWMCYHAYDPYPHLITPNLCNWDRNFLTMSQDQLFTLLLAADFLDIQGLLDLLSMTVAVLLRSKTSEELRIVFGLGSMCETNKQFSQAADLVSKSKIISHDFKEKLRRVCSNGSSTSRDSSKSQADDHASKAAIERLITALENHFLEPARR